MKFWLESGANVNAPGNRDVRFPWTVLTTAVEMNHLERLELLINAGADVNMPSFGYYGCNALEAAKSRPANSGIVNLLIAKVGFPQGRFKQSSTPHVNWGSY